VRLGVVKRAVVLIVTAVFFAWLFRSDKKRTVFYP
jgi:hypothetical protein